jgi:GNAT superfamily N-acetyltransferase
MAINFYYRDMTDVEFKREQEAFNEYGLEYGNPLGTAMRHGFVAMDDDRFIGCSSGLAQKSKIGYENYFYLTDLLVEKAYRKKGYGKELLRLLEEEIKKLGIKYIWTWTAEFEAVEFYKKQGYEIFANLDNWYPSGHNRVGLLKDLSKL